MGQSIDQRMNGSWDAYRASPADFAGADDLITNLGKGERAWDRDHRTHSLIFEFWKSIARGGKGVIHSLSFHFISNCKDLQI